jgi:hypothetical protein
LSNKLTFAIEQSIEALIDRFNNNLFEIIFDTTWTNRYQECRAAVPNLVPASIFLPAKLFSNAHKTCFEHFVHIFSYKRWLFVIVHRNGLFFARLHFLSAFLARHELLTKIFARLRKRLGTAGVGVQQCAEFAKFKNEHYNFFWCVGQKSRKFINIPSSTAND